ncbi:ABC transporter ATP-binding protein [Alphaproteobacteria bacterium]|nr:ABC transporter ATP-binding protein [Alphaproteobacteria bacterium]
MANIKFSQVGVTIPIYNARSRSLKSRLLQIATAGKLTPDENGFIAVRALQNLNLSFSEGDRVGLIGKNGAGKSTLLRVLGGVYHPTEGKIISKGRVISLIDVSLGIDHEATGRENIFLRGALLGLPKKEVLARLDEIIEFSELGDFIDMPVRTYSSGMHLRLAFSVSTVISPEILLMDEWLSIGDESFKHKAEARLAELMQATKILVIASHSRDLIMKTCTRVLWMEHGAIKMDGTPDDVCAAYFS